MGARTRSTLRKTIAGSIAAAAVSLPLAMASAPAAVAATSRGGCTVTPLAPDKIGASIRFRIQVRCVKDRIVQVHQQRYEEDAPAGIAGDDFLGQTFFPVRTFAGPGTVILTSTIPMPNTERGAEEVYQRVRFRVASIGGVTAFTAFERSVTRVF